MKIFKWKKDSYKILRGKPNRCRFMSEARPRLKIGGVHFLLTLSFLLSFFPVLHPVSLLSFLFLSLFLFNLILSLSPSIPSSFPSLPFLLLIRLLLPLPPSSLPLPPFFSFSGAPPLKPARE